MKKVGTLCYKHFPKLIPLFVLWRVKLSSSSNLPSWVLFNGELWFQKYYISVQFAAAAAAAKSLQSCPTVCDPIDGSPPGSPVPGILQARTLEWVAIAFSLQGGNFGKQYEIYDEGVSMLVRSSECLQQLSRKHTSRRKGEAKEWGEERKKEELTVAGQEAAPHSLHKSQCLLRVSACFLSQGLELKFRCYLPGPAQLRAIFFVEGWLSDLAHWFLK